MKTILMIGLGGFTGSIARYTLSVLIPQHAIPYGTLAANITGCFILGMITGFIASRGVSKEAYFFFSTGFCGSLTTFSTFTGESIALLEKNWMLSLLYMIISLAGGFIAFLLGTKLIPSS